MVSLQRTPAVMVLTLALGQTDVGRANSSPGSISMRSLKVTQKRLCSGVRDRLLISSRCEDAATSINQAQFVTEAQPPPPRPPKKNTKAQSEPRNLASLLVCKHMHIHFSAPSDVGVQRRDAGGWTWR